MNAGRRRSSLFAKTAVEAGAEAQALSVGKRIRYAMTTVTVVAGVFFLTTGIVAVSVSPDCDEDSLIPVTARPHDARRTMPLCLTIALYAFTGWAAAASAD